MRDRPVVVALVGMKSRLVVMARILRFDAYWYEVCNVPNALVYYASEKECRKLPRTMSLVLM